MRTYIGLAATLYAVAVYGQDGGLAQTGGVAGLKTIGIENQASQRLQSLSVEQLNSLKTEIASDKLDFERRREVLTKEIKKSPKGRLELKLISKDLSDAILIKGRQLKVVEKLQTSTQPGEIPLPQLIGAEVIAKLNPSVAICSEGPWTSADQLRKADFDAAKAKLLKLAPSVGRFSSYERTPGSGHPNPLKIIRETSGTGVAVGPDIVLTAQHVVALMVEDSSLPPDSWNLSTKTQFVINFPVQTSSCNSIMPSVAYEVVGLVRIGKGKENYDDLATIRVRPFDGASQLIPVVFDRSITLSSERDMGVLGYPDITSAEAELYIGSGQSRLFKTRADFDKFFALPKPGGTLFGIQRFGLGRFMAVADPNKRIIGHDAPTENSSSGSLVVDLVSGHAVGLHTGGNLGAGVNAGVNFAYRADYLANDYVTDNFTKTIVAADQ